MACFFCGGPWHEATGAWYSERVVMCGPCVRHFWRWFKGHSNPRKKTDFYGVHNNAPEGKGPWSNVGTATRKSRG